MLRHMGAVAVATTSLPIFASSAAIAATSGKTTLLWRTFRPIFNLFPSRCMAFNPSAVTILRADPDHKTDNEKYDLSKYPPRLIRNFSIVAHIDHGKSTLADRLLELTGTIQASQRNKQVLDKLQVERERGITVKAQSVSMFYMHKEEKYLINLIDTPGHVDFSYEVSRSLAACQGCILLVDAAQGIQAQTVANFYLAFENDLQIVPVLNKVDLQHADVEKVLTQMVNAFSTEPSEALKISAKTGLGVEEVLPAIIERVPPPSGNPSAPFKALLFDSWYDEFRGVICLIAVVDGSVKIGDKVMSASSGETYEVSDVGIISPEKRTTGSLFTGQVGYVIPGMKYKSEARVGDTLHHAKSIVTPLPGFKPSRPMVYAGIYPVDQSEYEDLKSSMDKLTLNDSSVSLHKEYSAALGSGWRVGFLGMLHMDVFNQRLEQEYEANVIITSPSVPFKARMKETLQEVIIPSPSSFPDSVQVECYMEPIVLGTIILPEEYLGDVINLCEGRRGVQQDLSYLDATRVMLKYKLPLCEIVTDFFDSLKGATSGYGSFDYEDPVYEPCKLVKLEIGLNGEAVDALSTIVPEERAYEVGKRLVTRLSETISRQMFEIAIQAKIHSKVVARESIKALRKNVTAKCYGGDVSRKKKLLEKQKEGKKKMKMIGNIELSKESFLSVLTTTKPSTGPKYE